MDEIAVLEEDMKELRQKLGDVEAEINKVPEFQNNRISRSYEFVGTWRLFYSLISITFLST